MALGSATVASRRPAARRLLVVPAAVLDAAADGAPAPLNDDAPSTSPLAVLDAEPVDTFVDVAFSDGASFRFHALWLRDACADANHVVADAGERILSMLPVNTGCDETLRAATCDVDDAGGLVVTWDNHETPSTFSAREPGERTQRRRRRAASRKGPPKEYSRPKTKTNTPRRGWSRSPATPTRPASPPRGSTTSRTRTA